MPHLPDHDQKVYRVALYNKEVRALVKENQSHWYYDDQWADVHKHDVTARDETEARSLVAGRFRPEDGFVIETVSPRRN